MSIQKQKYKLNCSKH